MYKLFVFDVSGAIWVTALPRPPNRISEGRKREEESKREKEGVWRREKKGRERFQGREGEREEAREEGKAPN